MIRKATPQDSLPVARLMLLAMGDIVHSFLGSDDPDQALNFVEQLAGQTDNQYSFENTWIKVEGETVIGSLTAYEGSDLQRLRIPVLSLLLDKYGREISPEEETQTGEVYIDTIAVHSEYQGRGIGTELLGFVIEELVTQSGKTLGLLVDVCNAQAKNLYIKKGFRKVGEKTLMNQAFEYFQLKREKEKMF